MRWPLDNFNPKNITNGFDAVAHQGNDLGAAEGTEIKAPENGVVIGINSGWVKGGFYGGNFVKVRGDSGYVYYMGHMKRTATGMGARVTEGQLIGYVGQTGQATGPHIHFEMTKGSQVLDPSKTIKQGSEEHMKLTKEQYLVGAQAVGTQWGKDFNYDADRNIDQFVQLLESQAPTITKEMEHDLADSITRVKSVIGPNYNSPFVGQKVATHFPKMVAFWLTQRPSVEAKPAAATKLKPGLYEV